MITHFLRRDFVTFKLYWTLIGVITAMALPIWFFHPSIPLFMTLGYCYLFFALAPINQFTGATWRSQHTMSRSYLLSLPINRKSLFYITQVRALIFWIPCFLLAVLVPIFGGSGMRFEFLKLRIPYPAFCLIVISTVVWFVNQSIFAQIRIERILGFSNPAQRRIAWVKYLLQFFIEFVVWSLPGLMAQRVPSVFLPLPAMALSVFKFFRARQHWLGMN